MIEKHKNMAALCIYGKSLKKLIVLKRQKKTETDYKNEGGLRKNE